MVLPSNLSQMSCSLRNLGPPMLDPTEWKHAISMDAMSRVMVPVQTHGNAFAINWRQEARPDGQFKSLL